MAKATVRTGEDDQPLHTRTTGDSTESQAVVVGIDGSDSVVPAHATDGLSVKVTNAVSVTDNGGSLTVDGAVGVSAALSSPVGVRLSDGTSALSTTSGELHVRDATARSSLVTIAGSLDSIDGATDGLEGGIGASSDAASTAGGAGSLSAKLRLATQQLADAVTALQRLDDAISGSEMQVDLVGSLPAGNNNIGDVDVASLTGGTIAHDAADSGNPIKTGGRARTALPAAVAQDDRVDAIHDKFGRRLMLVAPLDQRRSGTANFTGTSAADVIAAPGASTAFVVTRILVVNAHATIGTKVSVRDGTTAKAVGFAAALGGGWTIEDPNGLFVAATNTAVTAICGTTGADVDVTVFGYIIPA